MIEPDIPVPPPPPATIIKSFWLLLFPNSDIVPDDKAIDVAPPPLDEGWDPVHPSPPPLYPPEQRPDEQYCPWPPTLI